MKRQPSRHLPRIVIALSLTLPALAGCNGSPTGASAATTSLASTTPSTPLTTLSTGQTAAVTQNILPTLAVSNDVQTAVSDAEDLLQQLGPNAQGSAGQNSPPPGGSACQAGPGGQGGPQASASSQQGGLGAQNLPIPNGPQGGQGGPGGQGAGGQNGPQGGQGGPGGQGAGGQNGPQGGQGGPGGQGAGGQNGPQGGQGGPGGQSAGGQNGPQGGQVSAGQNGPQGGGSGCQPGQGAQGSATAYGYPPPPPPPFGGSRQHMPQLGFTPLAGGGMQLGGSGSASQASVAAPTVAYDATKKTFTLTATVQQPKSFRNFTSSGTIVQTFDASTLAAGVDPTTITTASALKALNLTLLESDSNMQLTDANGTNTAQRTESYSGTTVTIHEEITNTSTDGTRKSDIVRDSTLDQTTGVETGKSTTTVTQAGTVVSTISSTFTFQHNTGAASQTANDPQLQVQVAVNTDASGNQSGTVTSATGGTQQPAATLQGNGGGNCMMSTASGSLSVSL